MIKRKLFLLYLFALVVSLQTYAQAAMSDAKLEISQKAMSNPEYIVLPGDIYKLVYNIAGTPMEYTVVVDTDYSIRVSNLGIVNARGKTFVTVKKQVESLVAKNYPLSAVQFILVAPSTFTVAVKGEVSSTSELSVWALTRVSTVISNFRTQFSSTRHVFITSIDGITRQYDLFKSFREADLTQDPYLRPGDVITIPRADRIVHLTGAVERPGSYELLSSDTLVQLIEYYGGGFLRYSGVNKQKLKISRIVDESLASIETFFVDFQTAAVFQLKDKDEIQVETSILAATKIYVELPAMTEAGIATKEVVVSFVQGDTIDSLIRRNIGLFTTSLADTAHAFIVRGNERIPLNINPILFDASYTAAVVLEAGDRLVIPGIEQMVTVTGAVLKPGQYPYIPGRTFGYYIALAGGFDYLRTTGKGKAISIRDVYGKKIQPDSIIGPNTIITVHTNAFMYHFNIYVPLITVSATVISAVIAILSFARGK